ncbi:hypothetical protein [Pseudoponticoccus marisrubri]|uniref:DUF2946 domain-containing protein n=1 Tax=Pseudoponticoccus marisrubri TaxID=1685382 RepID=A0A0W7WNM3_9RHOB|nr:hypothetical protein [Pseudoponticoccus marisrubri]KUF12190.1 hypothetical protein AVJ23_00175 [Pseudoponticoccus marisrubri]
MTAVLRPLAGLALALMLVVTSLTLSAARGQAAPVGEMVICSGGFAVSVPVDAEGNPTGPAHICPDCALSLMMAVAQNAALPVPAAALGAVLHAPDGTLATGRTRPQAVARGPPGRFET